MVKLLVISLFCVFLESESAKILGIFPIPSISHQVVFRPLMQELAKHGHDVTVITSDPAFEKGQTPPNLTEIDLHDFSYKYWNEFLAEEGKEKDPVLLVNSAMKVITNLFIKQVKSNQVQELLKSNKKFDLLFIESVVQPALILSHIYKASVIEFSSLGGIFSAFDRFGADTHPLIYPNVFHKRIYNLTLCEKITEIYNHYSIVSTSAHQILLQNNILKKEFGPDTPDLEDLFQNVQMLFLNVHPIWDFNRPVPPNVVYLGGLHQKTPKELPKDLKSYLDSSKNGVIYVSFGTNVKPSWFPPDKLKVFTDVFSKLAFDILWKWDNTELPGRPQNVKVSRWLPQSDLLRHPKIKLFITQGGLQSTDEAITAGVPLIGVPMFGDQWFNVELYTKLNIGKQLDIETLTKEQLTHAINAVINDKSYRQNIVKLRDIINDQPQKPLERAVWWTEYVLRHGGAKHLRASGAGVNWTEYYELELVLILLVSILIILVIASVAVRYIVSKFRYYVRTNKDKVN